MLQVEHSAILSTFIKLPFVFKIALSIIEWSNYTGFTHRYCVDIFSYSGTLGILGSDGKQNTA